MTYTFIGEYILKELLILNTDNTPMVSMVDVAKKFNKEHRIVMRAFKNINCSEEFSLANFVRSDYVVRGKTYETYLMTKDGFSFLCLGFTGKDAGIWREKYILAFNAMEQHIAKQKQDTDLQWKQARLQIKDARKSFTDVVKEFVQYATEQGSKSAKMYYMNVTKMEYAALEMTQAFQESKTNFRDTLDMMELSFLTTAEHVAKNAINEGMERGFPYKEIYKLAKERVMTYAYTVNKPRIS